MSAIRLYRNAAKSWVFDHDGAERLAVLSSVDTDESFRSFGLHPNGAVSIKVCPTGEIDDVQLLDETPVAELYVPRGHSLYRDLTPV
jgi:hypothetical protein